QRCRSRRPMACCQSPCRRRGAGQGFSRCASRTGHRNCQRTARYSRGSMSLRTLASGLELLASLVITFPPRSLTIPVCTEPIPPFRIAGNLYYVGNEDLASYLIATPDGLILINCGLRESVPLIEQSVE